jgi:hypothetical protein
MKLIMTFDTGVCYITATPESYWEKLLLGAIANDAAELNAAVTYKPDGHFSYRKCDMVSIKLTAKE